MARPRLLDLPHGFRTMIDEADWQLVRELTLYRGVNGYAYFSQWIDGRSKPQTLHRFLMKASPGTHVDHINGDKLDNRRGNLRVVTPQANQVNRKCLNRNNTSGVRGVTRRGSRLNPWVAQITVSHVNIYLGSFPTVEAAAAARHVGELQYFGEACP